MFAKDLSSDIALGVYITLGILAHFPAKNGINRHFSGLSAYGGFIRVRTRFDNEKKWFHRSVLFVSCFLSDDRGFWSTG